MDAVPADSRHLREATVSPSTLERRKATKGELVGALQSALAERLYGESYFATMPKLNSLNAWFATLCTQFDLLVRGCESFVCVTLRVLLRMLVCSPRWWRAVGGARAWAHARRGKGDHQDDAAGADAAG